MVETRKKPNENSISLVRRFSTKLRMSGILLEARKRQFREKKLNKRARKEKFLHKMKKLAQIEERL